MAQILAFLFSRLGARVSPFTIRCIHLFFMAVLFILFFMLVPAMAFHFIESNW